MKKENKSAQSLLVQAQKCFTEKNIAEALVILSSIEQMPSFSYLDPTIQMKVLNIKGLAYFQKREYKPAEEYLLGSLAIAKEIGDQRAEHLRYENLSNIYIYQKSFPKGIYYLQESIRVKEASGNFRDIPRNLIQLASLQFGIDNNEAGRLALRKADELIKKHDVKDPVTITLLHFNVAMQLKRERKYPAAIKEYDLALTAALWIAIVISMPCKYATTKVTYIYKCGNG
jgi:tetratricopeptide (TPR) repeat protein